MQSNYKPEFDKKRGLMKKESNSSYNLKTKKRKDELKNDNKNIL